MGLTASNKSPIRAGQRRRLQVLRSLGIDPIAQQIQDLRNAERQLRDVQITLSRG